MFCRHHPVASLVLLAGSLALSTGCATIAHGPNQQIDVVTSPPGAVASCEGKSVVTPGKLAVRRKLKVAEIRIEKEGYAPQTVTLHRRQGKAKWLNLLGIPVGIYGGGSAGYGLSASTGLFAGVGEVIVGAALGGVALPFIALGVDQWTGAAFELEPARADVTLEPRSNEPLTSTDPRPGFDHREQASHRSGE
jgi:hypothetical protein